MNFDTACAKCPPGFSIKLRNGGWNEHHVQYGRDQKGELYWTAGMTVGGALRDSDIKSAKRWDNDGYAIYRWGRREPETKLPTFEEAFREIELNSTSTHAKALIKHITETVELRVQSGIMAGADPALAKSLVYGTTRDILEILDTKHEHQQVYTIARNKYGAPNMSGHLLDMFNEINS